jgi:thiamine biosynthesis lipoprotein
MPSRASRQFFDGVSAAIAAARETDGLFDPTVLPVLLRLGYDRSYAEILSDSRALPESRDSASGPAGGVWSEVVLDRTQRLITLPPDVQLDLGGIAKGLYADRLAHELAGWPGGIVSAGGDMRLWGTPPDDDSWIVGIEDPTNPVDDIAWFEVEHGGVATSGTNRRHWQRAGREVHHLIDPRTSLPVEGVLRSVTVVAETAADAEVAATAIFVAGGIPDDASWLASTASLAIGVNAAGEVVVLNHRGKGHDDASSIHAA